MADAIENARRELHFALWAYVFMPEHAHLIVYPLSESYDISEIRTAIKSPVGTKAIKYLKEHASEWLPAITRKRGKKTERLFWQSGGGYDRNIDEPATLSRELDYVHMNPVRRGLVAIAADFKWSSASWFLGCSEAPIIPDRIPPEWIA